MGCGNWERSRTHVKTKTIIYFIYLLLLTTTEKEKKKVVITIYAQHNYLTYANQNTLNP